MGMFPMHVRLRPLASPRPSKPDTNHYLPHTIRLLLGYPYHIYHHHHREVAELLEELAMHDLWAGRDGGTGTSGAGDTQSGATDEAVAAARARHAPYTRVQREALRTEVQRFLEAAGGGGVAADAGSSGGGDEDAPPIGDLGISSTRRLREVLYACRVGDACLHMVVLVADGVRIHAGPKFEHPCKQARMRWLPCT